MTAGWPAALPEESDRPAWSFAEVAVDVPIRPAGPATPADATGRDAAFTYAIPPELAERITTGQLVWVPFGRRRVQGVVIALRRTSPVERTREVLEVITERPVLSAADIALARWMSRHYLAPFFECLQVLLPPGSRRRNETVYRRTDQPVPLARLPAAERAVLATFGRARERSERQIARAAALPDPAVPLERLVAAGLLVAEARVTGGHPGARRERIARLVVEDADEVAGRLAGLRRSERHAEALAYLAAAGGAAAVRELIGATAVTRRTVQDLERLGLVVLVDQAVWRDPLAGLGTEREDAPALSADQARAWATIERLLGRVVWAAARPQVSFATRPAVCLVHGVTGSGKTELYLRAIVQALAQGRQAIVLVPEIALTPQTIGRFARRFPGRIGLWHSELSDGERRDTWYRAREGLLDVIIGSRSAVFAPLPRLGLIVVDEEHASAYKQAGTPRYHARDVAIHRAALTGAAVILGSATPAVESFWAARQGVYRFAELPRRVVATAPAASRAGSAARPRRAVWAELPPVEVVDLRAELKAGNSSIFSRALQAALGAVLAEGVQAILYLNRRGSATFVQCRDCGQVQACPRCRLPLTHHRAAGALTCHTCHHREPPPMMCPRCGSPRIRYFGAGTQRVEEVTRTLFPAARVLRWDADTTGRKGAHEAILARFAAGQADVLIGTQMIAKGLDLPAVTLVGVVAADTALHFPDYAASERAFQLLSQVAGRAGRSLRGGRVIIQTYVPDHPAIQCAARHDYLGFYEQEIAFRAQQRYPPFSRLVRLEYVSEGTDGAAARTTGRVALALRARVERLGLAETAVLGPAPAFFRHLRGRTRWQVIVQSPDPHALLADFPLPPGWRIDVDPVSLL
jgi:primosomal protein N' (replication factor Y)